MNVKLKRVTIKDIDEVIKMQKESFKPLLDKYHDGKANPYNESFDKVKYKIENYFYYFIIINGEKVGAIAINDKKDGTKKKIAPIYILPKFQNKGYGQLAMKEVERIHGEHDWKLDTILEEKGNCHLYEKFGYKQTGKFEKISDLQTIVFYEK
ncbi:MAG: GNAT family N-acetyltransferase [Bacilli bacterium]|nr:GNAT family N-acetyltransferase [Bacilli bacterium]